MSEAGAQPAEGRFSDGATAGVTTVAVTLAADALLIAAGDGRRWRWPAETVRLVPEEGGGLGLRLTSRDAPDARLVLSDGALLPGLRRLCPALEGGGRRRARLGALGSVLVAVALLIGAYFALPIAAAALAPAIPQAWQRDLGLRAENDLAGALSRSRDGGRICAASAGSEVLRALVVRLAAAAEIGPAPHVTVLEAGLVNAFALPGDRILLTRGLIELARDGNELAGVIAHELGHLQRGDPLAALIQRFEWNALTTLVFGGGTVGGFGETIVLLSYSRRVEARADESGLAILARAGIDSRGFAEIMRRMGAAESNAFAYLQSHPATAERVAAIERLGAPGAAALPEAAWSDLKRICAERAPFSVS